MKLPPLVLLSLLLAGCGREPDRVGPPPVTAPAKQPVTSSVDKILAAARSEVAKSTPYEPGYQKIAYPGGDVTNGGVCTDLVVRAFRGAGVDLQKLVHEDMRANFAEYPKLWNLSAPDPNIDHRRVPNLMVFLERKGRWLPTATAGADAAASWLAGDVVFWDLPNGLKHCGVVSDRRGAEGLPLVIHNISRAAEEDCLTRWKIIGHGRLDERQLPVGSREL